MTNEPTRGERNNNPCNLRYDGLEWLGLDRPPQDDGGYCRFIEALYGLRAGALDIRNQQRLHGLNTIRAIIEKFAPPNENATPAYIADVAARMNVAPDVALDLSDAAQLQDFLIAIVNHENGRCAYPMSLIGAAVRMALATK